tara:strand:+ start:514 stop:690 length:177 start_codon:yes stop_codon:yes gene_type:complete
MSYSLFIKDVLKTTDFIPTKEDMEFAYIVIYSNFKVTPEEAIKLTIDNKLPSDELNIN